MTGSAIKDLVIVKMEEKSAFGPETDENLLAGNDILDGVKPIYDYIDASMSEAANEMLLTLPLHRLASVAVEIDDDSVLRDTEIIINGKMTYTRTGKIWKPDNWLRFYTLWLVGWERPVYEVIFPSNFAYIHQFNESTRGTPQKPVVTDDGNWLHFYSIPEGMPASIKQFLYIPKFSLVQDYPIDVAELIALNVARKVFEVFGATEQVKIMQGEIESLLKMFEVV